MKIAVFGDRNATDTENVLARFHEFEKSFERDYSCLCWLFGGADGASKIVANYLNEINDDVILFKPWHMIDTRLGFSTKYFYMRNKQLVSNADLLLVLTAPNSNDNEVDSALRLAEKYGVQVYKVFI